MFSGGARNSEKETELMKTSCCYKERSSDYQLLAKQNGYGTKMDIYAAQYPA